jgi:hypothetical protein
MQACASRLSQWRRIVRRVLLLSGLLCLLSLSTLVINAQHLAVDMNATITSPVTIGGLGGKGDARDLDAYPVVAYDASTRRYLAAWLSPYNATSSSSGFDVYGVFLDQRGHPIGDQFRISDRNRAARGSMPTVAGGDGSFVVAWSIRGTRCTVAVQKVTAVENVDDTILLQGEQSYHSPTMRYDENRRQFVLVAVAGNDYLPLKQGDASTADCGNDAGSTSQIVALAFTFDTDNQIDLAASRSISPPEGAFRPHIAVHPDNDHYLAVWEDRRNSSAPYEFAVYGQFLNPDLELQGENLALSSEQDYQNMSTEANWTPRPAVAASNEAFLATWFERTGSVEAPVWSTIGRTVLPDTESQDAITIDQVTFSDPRTAQPPTGFVDVTYVQSTQEFLVASATYAERLWGYLSEVRLQRLSATGQLLSFDDGALSDEIDTRFIDPVREDRIGVSLGSGSGSRALVVYGRLAPDTSNEQDFDIWSAEVLIGIKSVYLPFISR